MRLRSYVCRGLSPWPEIDPVNNAQNRRRHARLSLPPMYTLCAVRLLDETQFRLEGHTYDISEGGIQFELDEPIAPGTQVAVQIFLPNKLGNSFEPDGPGRAIFVFGNVVWLDDSEPGPVRMAVAFTRFARAGDEERLRRRLTEAGTGRAAA